MAGPSALLAVLIAFFFFTLQLAVASPLVSRGGAQIPLEEFKKWSDVAAAAYNDVNTKPMTTQDKDFTRKLLTSTCTSNSGPSDKSAKASPLKKVIRAIKAASQPVKSQSKPSSSRSGVSNSCDIGGAKKAVCYNNLCPSFKSNLWLLLSTVSDLGKGDATAFIAAAPKDHGSGDEIVVAIRGSSSPDNWVANLKLTLTDGSHFCPGCQLHKGFASIWNDLKPGIVKELKELIAAYPERKKLVLTGHSQGAAVASLAWADLKMLFPTHNVQVYAFASPRFANEAFAKHLSKSAKGMYRITSVGDPVVRVPPRTLGYQHVGPEYYISVRTANPTTKDIIVCPDPANINGAVKDDGWSVADHTRYFHQKISDGDVYDRSFTSLRSWIEKITSRVKQG